MENAIRTLILFALAGAAVSVAAWVIAWRLEVKRRLKRTLRRVLGAEPDAETLSPLQGRALGLSVDGQGLAALWDKGASGLVYRFDEIEGAELIIDGEVKARVHRSEPAKALDRLDPLAERVSLRLLFDTPRWPEFELDLLSEPGAGEAAVREGRRWLAHISTLLKRQALRRAQPKPASGAPEPARARPEPEPEPEPTPEAPPKPPAPSMKPARPKPADDRPPWEDDEPGDADDDSLRLL